MHLLSSSSVNSQTEVCTFLLFAKIYVMNAWKIVSTKLVVEIAVTVLEKYFNSGIELKIRIIFLI